MRHAKHPLLLACLIACFGCATGKQAPENVTTTDPEQRGFSVVVTKVHEDLWHADYSFDAPYSALLFDSLGGRTETWTPKTQATHFERSGHLDVVAFSPPARGAHFAIDSNKTQPEGTQPFIQFSDGSEAVNVGLFPVLTVASLPEAKALKGNLGRWKGHQPEVSVQLVAPGRLITPDGASHQGSATLKVKGGGGYAYIGDIKPSKHDMFTAIIDPGLPKWLQDRFADDLTHVYSKLASRWGFEVDPAFVLLAFAGTEGELSNRGYAAGSQISMSIGGEIYAAANQDALIDLVWFFAHEAAHHFQFHGGLKREPGADWITEGAANAMAVGVLFDMGLIDRAWMQRRYWKTHRSCVAELADGPLRGKQGRAGYVCGDLLAQMTAAALPDHDYFGFWAAFQAEAKADDGRLSHQRYFDLLERRGVPKETIHSLESILVKQVGSPANALRTAMEGSGLAPRFAPDGGLSDMAFPIQGLAAEAAE